MKRHLKKYYNWFNILLLVSLTLSGCGNGSAGGTSEESALDAAPVVSVDWSSYQITPPQTATTGDQWYVTEYHDDWITPCQQEYDNSYQLNPQVLNGVVYQWTSYSKGNQTWNYMDYFDSQTGQSFQVELDFQEPPNTFLRDMTMAGDKLAAFLVYGWEEASNSLSSCSLIYCHLEDGIQKTLDLLPALADAGITVLPGSTERSVLCDTKGCIYLAWEDSLIIVSEAGELLYHMEAADNVSLSCLCVMPDGSPMFVREDMNNRTNTYLIYDHDAKEMKSLGESKYIVMKHGCMDHAGNLYFFTNTNNTNGYIVRWDTLSGSREKIFDCDANSICTNTMSYKAMTIRENGDLVIMDPISEHRNIYVLSPKQPETERTLTLVSTSYTSQPEQTAAILFTQRHPEIKIDYTCITDNDDWEAYVDNLLNRIVSGDAPDMFIIPVETMQTLYEKGALADLTDVMPAEIREQVFDSVWKAGTIDDKLVGLATVINASGMLVSKELWPEATWTLEDILTLAENAPEGTLKGLIPLKGYLPDPMDALYKLALVNIDSTFVDLKTGTCNFDCDAFRKVLQYCKDTPIPEPNPDIANPLPARAVMDGEYLADACDIYNFPMFSTQMSLFSEDYHWVGFPTDKESGNLIYTSCVLAVSKDTQNMDLIQEFLPTLYSEKLESLYPNICVRKDVLRKRVVEHPSNPDEGVGYYMGEGTYQILKGKPDGTSYVEEYIDFIESCTMPKTENSRISNIVLEEVAAYFSGDKTVDAVIAIIQSRVQLYLDENK